MSETKKMSPSSYLMIAAAVLGIIGLVAYSTSENAVKQIGLTAGVAIALNIITVIIVRKHPYGILNFASTISALLFAFSFVYSFTSQLDPLGWAVSGLYTWGQFAGFLVFATLMLVALILEFIVSFRGMER